MGYIFIFSHALYMHIFTNTQSNAVMTKLSLTFNQIGSEGALALGEALKARSWFFSCVLSRKFDTLEPVVLPKQFNSTLTWLDVAHNGIDCLGAVALGRGLLVYLTNYQNNMDLLFLYSFFSVSFFYHYYWCTHTLSETSRKTRELKRLFWTTTIVVWTVPRRLQMPF